MIYKLKEKVEEKIKSSGKDLGELQKYTLIKEILNQKDCFKRISIEYAYAILRDLDIPEDELKNVYEELI